MLKAWGAAEENRRALFLRAPLFTTDLSRATAVTLSLSAEINARLAEKLRRELRRGARVVSYRFGIAGWTPDETVRTADGHTLFLWTVK